ncbi:MAG: two-component system sensor histidine kinase CreC [Psychrobium sp.]
MTWPKIPFGLRIFLLYAVFVGFCAYLVLRTMTAEIKPGVRQTMEETLVDMASLIAVVVANDVKQETLNQSQYPRLFRLFGEHTSQASIWGMDKVDANKRIYITDRNGIVILDSDGRALGQDYSRWNDVYLTLRGDYGARTTKLNIDDELSTVMHVAAPIFDGDNIIGSVTVAKANIAMQPFIERSKNRLILWGIVLGSVAMILGALISWRITKALGRLSDYAEQTIKGHKVSPPQFRVFYEYGDLAQVIDRMRHQLEGKNYAERYVQSLTHELKSPIAAIRGASEILQTSPEPKSQQRFLSNIEHETKRLHLLIERMLNLSAVEKQQMIESRQSFSIKSACKQAVRAIEGECLQRSITLQVDLNRSADVSGDELLLQQAIVNLLQNAVEFSPLGGLVSLNCVAKEGLFVLTVFNQGEAIPDFALEKLQDRFFSLPRPSTGKKSTGLGLNFVTEVVKLHSAQLTIINVDGGVEASIKFSQFKKRKIST